MRQYRGLPEIHIERGRLMQMAHDHGYLPIQKEDRGVFEYIVDKNEAVLAIVTASNGYLKIPAECLDELISDLQAIKEMYL